MTAKTEKMRLPYAHMQRSTQQTTTYPSLKTVLAAQMNPAPLPQKTRLWIPTPLVV